MPATRKEIEESMMGGRGGECDASGVGGRRAAAVGGGSCASVGGSGSAYPVADGDERGATSLPVLDSTVHTIYRSPSLGAWMPDSDAVGNMSRYSLLPAATATAATTASIQQMESAAAMMKLACRNRLHDRMVPGSERRNSTPGGDVTGGSEGASGWRLPAPARAAAAVAAGAAAGAEAPAPLRGDPELPRPAALGLPIADVCEASVARQRAPRDHSSSSDEGLGLDRQPSLTDLRSLDSECDNLAAAMPPMSGRRRPKGLHEQPFSGHRIHQSQSPPHDRMDSLRSSRQMSASTTFHGLHSLPGYTERKGTGNKDAAEALEQSDGQLHVTGMSAGPSPVDYQMWSNKIVELQQMSDSLTQGIANFIRIAASSDPQYKDAMPPLVPNYRYHSTAENNFSRKTFDGSSSIVTSRTVFSRTNPAVDTERHCDTTNAGRDNCMVSRMSCTVSPADISGLPERHEEVNLFERGRISRTAASPRCGSYLYQDQSSIGGPPRAGVGDTVDSLVTIATIPSLRGVGLDANETLKRQSAEISGDIGGYRPGVIPIARRQCTGESGDFEPPGPLVNSETTSSVEVGHCSRNCICKEDCPCATRASTEVYPNDLPTLTLFERIDNDVENCSAVGVNPCATEESIATEIHKRDSSSTNETTEDSVAWLRSARSETVISSRTSDFVVPNTGINYTFPPAISGIDEMRAMLAKERNVNNSESLGNDCFRCYERNGEIGNARPLGDDIEPKNAEGGHDLKSSDKNVSGCSLGSSRDSSGEPSYSLEQHFLPTTAMSYINELRETETDRVTKINSDVQDERNACGSKSVASNITRGNDTVENLKKEHSDYSETRSNNPSRSAATFKTVKEEKPMENVCISTCALKTLLSGHGIMEDVKEMRKLSTATSQTSEMASHLKPFRETFSAICRLSENEVQSDLEEHGRLDTLKHEMCRTAEQQGTKKDAYCESHTSVRVNTGISRVDNVVDAALCDTSLPALAAERDTATSRERSRSATPAGDGRSSDACRDPVKEDAGDDSTSATTSASTSLFGSVVQAVEAAARSGSSTNSSSASELIAPTNSFEDVPNSSRRSPVRYDARETLNLVRDLIWKDSTYNTLRPEHDTEPSCQQYTGAAVVENERKSNADSAVERQAERRAAATNSRELQSPSGLRGGVRTVLQPRHQLRHDRSSQTCVAVREFPNIPATDSLQRTLKTTNLKGAARSPNISPRAGSTAAWAARLHNKANAAPIRSGPAVPGGWPAVCARPLARPPATAATTGLSRSAGSSPRVPCSAYTREPSSRGSAREVAVARSKDATAADALLADAASLFRAKLDACDRRQGEPRRLQKNRPLSATARLSAPGPAGPPPFLRMMRPGTSSGRRQPLQEQDSWHQRQQQLQQRQLQLQQRQQQLQQRQLQLQQRQQMQQRQQLFQRQQRVQQTATWQQRLNQTQLAKPTSRRPPSRMCGSSGAAEAVGSACLRDVTSGGCGPEMCADVAPGSASLRMLQARLRAGGSLHRGVAAEEATAQLWLPHREDKPRSLAEPEDAARCEARQHALDAGDGPTRDDAADGDPCLRGGDLTELGASDAPPVTVEQPQAEEVENTREAESHDRQEMQEADDGKYSTNNTRNCQAPIEPECEASSGVCGSYSDTSSFLNVDLVNVDAKISDLSLLSEHCTLRFVNYLPSAPVRERDEEDFIRELLLSNQGDMFKGSFNTSPHPQCVSETEVCDSMKPPDRENSGTLANVQSEHLIEPPAAFCSDVKATAQDESVCSSQTPGDIPVTCNEDGDPTVPIPPSDGPDITHTGDADLKASCSRVSSDSSIKTHGETDTKSNVATTNDFDKLAETIELTSDSDTNHDSLDEDNAITIHPSCSRISTSESSLNIDRERTLENHTVGQNCMSQGNSHHEDDPMLFCCGLCSIQTTPLTRDKKNTVCEFVAGKCSPLETDDREKCANVVKDVATGETTGREGNSLKDNGCTMLPIQPSSLSVGDGNKNQGNAAESYDEEQVMHQERANGKKTNVADRSQGGSDLEALVKPCTALPTTPSLAIFCDETTCSDSTDNNDVTHEPSIQETMDVVKSHERTTEQNEEDNSTIISCSFTSPCDSHFPTVSSECTDCGYTTEKSMRCPSEDRGNRIVLETNLDNMAQKTSVSLPNKPSLSSLLSEGSSLSLWYTSTDDDCAMDSSIEPKTTIEEECREMIQSAVDACGRKTVPCVKQDISVDVSQTEKCLTDVATVDVVNNSYDDEENDANINVQSRDLQGDDSFRDAEDDSISIKSLNDEDLTDASSISDPFSTVQFLSDSDEASSTPVVDNATSCRLSTEPSTNYVDECFNQLCVILDRSQEERALHENSNGELNKTDIDNNTETNGKVIPAGTDTSQAVTTTASVPETSSVETHDAQQTQVVDGVTSATSWVTVSSISFSELPVESSISSVAVATTQNMMGNSQEDLESFSGNYECIGNAAAYGSCSVSSSGVPVEGNILSLAITGAESKMENIALQAASLCDNAKCSGDAAAEENTIGSFELVTDVNTSSLIVDGTENEIETNEEHVHNSSDNAERIQDTVTHESYNTPSPELLLEEITSYLTIVGAQTILEDVKNFSGNADRLRDGAEDESYTICSIELTDEANVSSPVVGGTHNKVEISVEAVENSSVNSERVQVTASYESQVTATSELLVEEIPSSIALADAKNNLENVESSSDIAERIRDTAEDEISTIRSSELADEANMSSQVDALFQNKEDFNAENVESASDNTERLQDTATHESYITASFGLQTEANISSEAIVGAKNNLENTLEHIEISSEDVERIRHTTACESQTPENDATTGTQEDGDCADVSNEEISKEIPLGEPSASWETLSEQSYTTDEDPVDNTRETAMTTQPQHRRRRHTRDAQWRAARAELEEERRTYDLVLASPEVEVHLSEALSHSEAEQPLMPASSRFAAVGTAGGAASEVLVAALAGVAMADADADAEDATDILYGSRDLHNAAVEAAVACVVDSELRDLSALYAQRLGGCLLVNEPQSANTSQAPMLPEDDAHCSTDEDSSSSGTPPPPPSTTPPESPPPSARGLESAPSSCSLHDRALPLSDAAADGMQERPRSHTIATLLTICVFLAAYSSCVLLDPNLHLP